MTKLLSLRKKIRAVNQVMFYNQVQQFLHNPLENLPKFVSDILLGSSVHTGVYRSWFNYILFAVLELSLLPWSSTMCLSHFFSMKDQAEMLRAGFKAFQNEVCGRCLVAYNIASLTEKKDISFVGVRLLSLLDNSPKKPFFSSSIKSHASPLCS